MCNLKKKKKGRGISKTASQHNTVRENSFDFCVIKKTPKTRNEYMNLKGLRSVAKQLPLWV